MSAIEAPQLQVKPLALAAAALAGLSGFGLLFSDSPGLPLAPIAAGAIAVAGSAISAAISPTRWIALALLSSWGVVTWGLGGILMYQPRLQLMLAVVPLAMIAGWVGARYGGAWKKGWPTEICG